MPIDDAQLAVRQQAVRITPGDGLEPLVAAVGDARLVLIGEATHGTHEFYRIRAELTRALVEHRGFTLVAVEADWPDAYRVNRWVRHSSTAPSAELALGGFIRFPRWMWRNHDVVEFLEWLHAWNASRPARAMVGFYGLDLYSLNASAAAVLGYLANVDPEAAARARRRYGCFEDFGDDPQSYGYAATLGLSRSCEDEVVAQLADLRRRAGEYVGRDGSRGADDYFYAEQNARLVRNAEEYYRAMFGGRVESWNLRDTHMVETLEALLQHAARDGTPPRAVVWAHNSHLGDARATQMAQLGELNVGQLVRQAYGRDAFLVGFTTHAGTVTAASDWGAPAQCRQVRPALTGSYERLFHDSKLKQFVLALGDGPPRDALLAPRLERAIGVIYRPDTERQSHYFRASLPDQFDAVVHIDTTSAVRPLELWAQDEADAPETFPSGF
jgi:erythromycin esterase-like protein